VFSKVKALRDMLVELNEKRRIFEEGAFSGCGEAMRSLKEARALAVSSNFPSCLDATALSLKARDFLQVPTGQIHGAG
jgi:hypothetical protein